MTVQELIAVLQNMPQDAEVVYRCASDYTALEPEQVRLFKAEEKVIVKHNTSLMEYDPYLYRDGTKPDFRTVVAFPGL